MGHRRGVSRWLPTGFPHSPSPLFSLTYISFFLGFSVFFNLPLAIFFSACETGRHLKGSFSKVKLG